MSKPEPAYVPAPPRFQIASRLGAFRDTAVISDPFGTGATFTIHRHGSRAYKSWFQRAVDKDPLTLLRLESMFSDDRIVLTKEEQETLLAEREKPAPGNPLVPIVDRLTIAHVEQSSRKDALRKLIDTGRMSPSEMAGRQEQDTLEEAVFTLKSWEGMPGEDGALIPYSEEMARELLTNDTPLEGAGLDELILGVDAWTVEVTRIYEPGEEIPKEAISVETDDWTYKIRIIIPGLTLGLAYQYLFLRRARDKSLFRDQALEAAAKNSEPSSDSSTSSGDGQSAAAS